MSDRAFAIRVAEAKKVVEATKKGRNLFDGMSPLTRSLRSDCVPPLERRHAQISRTQTLHAGAGPTRCSAKEKRPTI